MPPKPPCGAASRSARRRLRPKIYFLPLDRRLLGVFYYEGKEYDFNFSKLHLMVKTEFSFEEQADEVEATHAGCEYGAYCEASE